MCKALRSYWVFREWDRRGRPRLDGIGSEFLPILTGLSARSCIHRRRLSKSRGLFVRADERPSYDFPAANRFLGENPPVRTTIAAAGGIPGNSLVEIDVIAFI